MTNLLHRGVRPFDRRCRRGELSEPRAVGVPSNIVILSLPRIPVFGLWLLAAGVSVAVGLTGFHCSEISG